MLNRKRSPFSLFPTFSKFCGFLQWDFDLLLGFVIVVVFFLKLSSSAILIFLKLQLDCGRKYFTQAPSSSRHSQPSLSGGKKGSRISGRR